MRVRKKKIERVGEWGALESEGWVTKDERALHILINKSINLISENL